MFCLSSRNALLPAALLSLGLTQVAHAQNTFFPEDATVDYNVGYAVVGYANQSDLDHKTNGTSPTVNFSYPYSLYSLDTYNNSVVVDDASTNFFGAGVQTHDRSTVFVSSDLEIAVARDNSTLYFYGYLRSGALAFGHSVLHITGTVGVNASVNCSEHSTGIMDGGSIGDLGVGNDATLLMNIGHINGTVFASGHCHVFLNGGTIGQAFIARENAHIIINNRSVGGGIFLDQSVAEIRGGGSNAGATAYDQSVINVYGTDLKATLTDPDFILGNKYHFSVYTLSGKLSDGTSVNGVGLYVQNETGARFTLNNPKPRGIHPIPGKADASLLLRKRTRRA